MCFIMTTKLILHSFLFFIISASAFAQVGERCVLRSTGAAGFCQLANYCPIVAQQAENGITPTICGYYQFTVPIVCCETTRLNPETQNQRQGPNRYQTNQQETNKYETNREEPNRYETSREEPNKYETSREEPNRYETSREEPNRYETNREPPNRYETNREEPNRFEPNRREPSRNQGQGHREPSPNTFLPEEPNPDAVVYPDPEDDHVRPAQHLSRSEQKCEEYEKAYTGSVQAIPLVINTEAATLNFEKCDYNGVALIVGGKPASAGEFPFMAAIGFYVENKVEWRCGGTLVSDEYVLTAAHCTFTRDGDTPKVVRLGELDLARDDDSSVYADYNIRNITVHPRYRYPLKYNDIALIKLTPRVKFTKYIRPACLYTKSRLEQSQGVATGWGKTDYAAAEISDRLMKVTLSIYDNSQCAQTYQVNKQLPQGIKNNMVCAGELSGGMDTCQGDSGGPLLFTKKTNQCKFYVVGITSFGKSCGQANTPAIYTKVSAFVPWIEKTIW